MGSRPSIKWCGAGPNETPRYASRDRPPKQQHRSTCRKHSIPPLFRRPASASAISMRGRYARAAIGISMRLLNGRAQVQIDVWKSGATQPYVRPQMWSMSVTGRVLRRRAESSGLQLERGGVFTRSAVKFAGIIVSCELQLSSQK